MGIFFYFPFIIFVNIKTNINTHTMGNENQTLDKTYTSSENSVFNSEGVDLMILLPEKSDENPYLFKAFDISQMVNGEQQNALFIYMKKQTDDASDLSGYDDDKCECSYSFRYGEMTQLENMTSFSSFNPAENRSLVIVYHDDSDDKDYQFDCAVAAFATVASMAAAVALNGNFQTELNLMGIEPRKAGMSSLPKR